MQEKKRKYNTTLRQKGAGKTREAILKASRSLFQKKGYECVTLKEIAQAAGVSLPSIYSIYQSKIGILSALVDELIPSEVFEQMVKDWMEESNIKKKFEITAKMVCSIYDAEKEQVEFFRGVSSLTPELKKLEKEREKRRYERQKIAVAQLIKEKKLKKGLTESEARDILWAYTSREMYRMFVVLRSWKSSSYEKWLGKALLTALTDC